MFKRLSWLTMGAGLGFGVAVWGRRKVRATVERYRPSAVTASRAAAPSSANRAPLSG